MADAAHNGNLDLPRSNGGVQPANPHEDKVRFYELVRHLIDDLALLFRKELALAGSEVSQTLSDSKKGLSRLLSAVVVFEQPLLIGALAMAAGAALGTLLPKTSTEDRVMGDWSDKGSDAIKEKAEEKLQDLQGKSSSDSSGRDDAPPSGDDSSDGKGPGPSAAPPPPTSPGTARDSGNSHRGASY
ncbi:MAG: hypothetical protein HLUCCX14_02675 [Marinobacter excellens HL-55]|uniref:Uncharacterized protein n=1 Tax=Marinobacter excellens HL-55 TaxID=1305731 RepID=A0A0P8B994_9GAMM|nr:MAG: hypothetical protein HLUCCX14_02675 [Marinobacter excellens HL-55]